MSSLLQTILGYISLFLDDFDVFRFFFFFLRTLNKIKVVVENVSEEDYIRHGVTCSYRVIWLYRVRMWP